MRERFEGINIVAALSKGGHVLEWDERRGPWERAHPVQIVRGLKGWLASTVEVEAGAGDRPVARAADGLAKVSLPEGWLALGLSARSLRVEPMTLPEGAVFQTAPEAALLLLPPGAAVEGRVAWWEKNGRHSRDHLVTLAVSAAATPPIRQVSGPVGEGVVL